MSSAAAAAAPAGAPSGSKKKLIIIIAAVLVLALGGGGAAMFMMKSKAAAAAAADGDEDAAPAKEESHAEGKKVPPVFVPLDPFTVNLADQDAERYAQIGVTLQVDDAHVAEDLKLYMPAIRNGVLMVLSHKTAKELGDRAGKEQLADEIMKEAVRPLGIDLDDGDDDHAKADDSPKKKKKKKKVVHNPIKGVFFSSFIVQ